jgi:hypothetical protein
MKKRIEEEEEEWNKSEVGRKKILLLFWMRFYLLLFCDFVFEKNFLSSQSVTRDSQTRHSKEKKQRKILL